MGSFYFSSSERYFLKYKARKFHFGKYKKVPFPKIQESVLGGYFLQNILS